jgi:hypothetical protein
MQSSFAFVTSDASSPVQEAHLETLLSETLRTAQTDQWSGNIIVVSVKFEFFMYNVFDRKTQYKVSVPDTDDGRYDSVYPLRNGNYIVHRYNDGEAMLSVHDKETGNMILSRETDRVKQVCERNNGEILFPQQDSECVAVWNIETNKIRRMLSPSYLVKELRDGRGFSFLDHSGAIVLHDENLDTVEMLPDYECVPVEHEQGVLYYASNYMNTIYIYNIDTKEEAEMPLEGVYTTFRMNDGKMAAFCFIDDDNIRVVMFENRVQCASWDSSITATDRFKEVRPGVIAYPGRRTVGMLNTNTGAEESYPIAEGYKFVCFIN